MNSPRKLVSKGNRNNFFILLFLLLIPLISHSQNNQLRLLSGSYELEENVFDLNEKDLLALDAIQGKKYAILQFSTVPNSEERAKLEHLGVSLLEYLPERSFFASAVAQCSQASRTFKPDNVYFVRDQKRKKFFSWTPNEKFKT